MMKYQLIIILVALLLLAWGLFLYIKGPTIWNKAKSFASAKNKFTSPNETVYRFHMMFIAPLSVLSGLVLLILAFV